jgi:hypothetical protein
LKSVDASLYSEVINKVDSFVGDEYATHSRHLFVRCVLLFERSSFFFSFFHTNSASKSIAKGKQSIDVAHQLPPSPPPTTTTTTTTVVASAMMNDDDGAPHQQTENNNAKKSNSTTTTAAKKVAVVAEQQQQSASDAIKISKSSSKATDALDPVVMVSEPYIRCSNSIAAFCCRRLQRRNRWLCRISSRLRRAARKRIVTTPFDCRCKKSQYCKVGNLFHLERFFFFFFFFRLGVHCLTNLNSLKMYMISNENCESRFAIIFDA